MKVLYFGAFNWGLGTKGPHNDPADKTFLLFVKNGVKTSVAGSCTKIFWRLFGAIALSYPPFFIDDSGAEFHAD